MYTFTVPTGWLTSYSWRKLAMVAILSYETADDQLEYYIQCYQTVNNTVNYTQYSTDTTGLELDCDIVPEWYDVCGIQYSRLLHYRCIWAVSRRNVNTLQLSRNVRHLMTCTDRHNIHVIEYLSISALTVCNHGITRSLTQDMLDTISSRH